MALPVASVNLQYKGLLLQVDYDPEGLVGIYTDDSIEDLLDADEVFRLAMEKLYERQAGG